MNYSIVVILLLVMNPCIATKRSSQEQIKKSNSDENLQNARIVSAILNSPDNASHSDLATLCAAWSKIKTDLWNKFKSPEGK